KTRLAGLRRLCRGIAWSPDGAQLAVGDDAGQICIWDTADGNLRREFHAHDGAVQSISWHPDGRRLATASDDSSIRLWDSETGSQVLVLSGWTSGQLAWSPDGLKL